jgi:hypothetical protein
MHEPRTSYFSAIDIGGDLAGWMSSWISASRAGGRANLGAASPHGRSCGEVPCGVSMASRGGTFPWRFVRLMRGARGERRGKPDAGNPPVRFGEGPLARTCSHGGLGSTRQAQAEYTAVTQTLNAAQWFDTADFVDLGHFCQELSKRSKSATVKAVQATSDAVKARGGFVIAEGHKGTSVANAAAQQSTFAQAGEQGVQPARCCKSDRMARVLDACHNA